VCHCVDEGLTQGNVGLIDLVEQLRAFETDTTHLEAKRARAAVPKRMGHGNLPRSVTTS